MDHSSLTFTGQSNLYQGKVRDVHFLEHGLLALVASDRLSAFDVILPVAIPHKGQVLNQMAAHFLKATEDIVPNWLLATPDPVVAVGYAAKPFKVEMVIRGYLAGHAARTYAEGDRLLCGVKLPDGLKENDPLPEPIITPSTKADQGDHDMDISREDIISQGIVSASEYQQLEDYTKALFQRGTEMAAKQGLILVDTKYEFGQLPDGQIVVIDEIHTADSSRYFHQEGYQARQDAGQKQKQLSKEFVREYLMDQGFQGQPGQVVPDLTEQWAQSVSQRYIELYEHMTGEAFEPASQSGVDQRIQDNVERFLATYMV
ncbi:MAG: phosphoribosylaminoimidazolesuccinocarboxamide synthase [Schleiferiaceae bacterium]|jgi:phosphoribosylaminoimidazole-succinocarboxamide synthase|nr:phosphoribosylaminoimidazolesuccinocarboxamide synthase [Flavobacteriales bacterium]MDG1220334.1 phosphoribosylaminoimidazolesuccinocarboxamide synthase [Schleiferiaceae bacterium]MBT7489214.1 phosphoribosylaminoimidazolesuccinocarboxamide synthase [Flavobacteriales bacterium]MCO4749209.1 phosphoribosylaminoimidazolesuccinocarboxamide synthase [Flavobacteriales bacterium]MDO7566458.1 phosphoribosylaminoimidazolesuccinocarboxamide synthase [Schleiferiaceae bacterium]